MRNASDVLVFASRKEEHYRRLDGTRYVVKLPPLRRKENRD